jgi:protein phosphatase
MRGGKPHSDDSTGEPGLGYLEVTDLRRIVAPTDHLCGITDVGRVRPHNEDTFHVSPDGRVLIVADGMGGHEAGEVASALAVEALVEFFGGEREKAAVAGEEPMERLLVKAFEAAHERVRKAAESREGCEGMGTTLILAYILGDWLHTCHVGDVRCYVHGATGLKQVTQDHSLVGALVRAGHLRPDEARRHPRRNEILQAVGLATGTVPEVHAVELAAGDLVLLCSDGLWEALTDDEIEAILAWEGSMRQRATQLVDRANAAGGRDNITVVLYEHTSGRTRDELVRPVPQAEG